MRKPLTSIFMSNYTKEQLMYLEKEALRSIAEDMQIKLRSNASKKTIIYAILDYQATHNVSLSESESQQTVADFGLPLPSTIETSHQDAMKGQPISTTLFADIDPTNDTPNEVSLEANEAEETEDIIEEDEVLNNIPEDIVFIITEDIPVLNEFGEEIDLATDNEFAPSDLISQMGLPSTNTLSSATEEATEATTNVQAPSTKTQLKTYSFDNLIVGEGLLEIMPEGLGYLRSADYNYMPSPDDIYVSAQQIKQYGLKNGDVVEGPIRIPKEGERYYPLVSVTTINGVEPSLVRNRVPFEHLTPLFPEEKFKLCNGHSDSISCRIVDLFTPIGKGQRALIVAQPKTGKTILMKDIANAIARNNPETYLIMLLIDERPEEVTDMARTVNAEVIASTFDEPASQHVRIAGMVLEKAKRLVECGQDVVIFLDSITRLARAYNTVSPASGKVLSGGVDANALQKPKRFFGAARNIEGGGSLTIIATALTDTGSKMDEVIFEEFKGTGNMELQLDRSLSNKRIFPAVNTLASSTRRDDLLHDPQTQNYMWKLRKYISEMTSTEALTLVKKGLTNTKTNEEYLHSFISSQPLD